MSAAPDWFYWEVWPAPASAEPGSVSAVTNGRISHLSCKRSLVHLLAAAGTFSTSIMSQENKGADSLVMPQCHHSPGPPHQPPRHRGAHPTPREEEVFMGGSQQLVSAPQSPPAAS